MKEDIYIYPTDTVWGIGGNIHGEDMSLRVNLIKGHSSAKPLSILFYNLDMLADYFQLETMDRQWLIELFQKETTLGLPVSWLKKEIPSEAYSGSSFVCVRVLSQDCILKLVESAGGPVYTTSFNKKDHPPITNQAEAEKLKKELCPEANLLGADFNLSGHSSTIVVLGEDNQFSILRPGNRVDEIKKHIQLLAT